MTPHPPLPEILRDARAQGGAVGAFNVVLLEHAEAIVTAAERVRLPVILQISENCVRYHGSLAPIVLASLALAQAATVPVFVHLDHIEDTDLIREGIDLGVDSVMYDGSRLAYSDNIAATAAIVELCHASGIAVEAELGEIGGKDGVHAPGARTDPDEARSFTLLTGIDALAVAVGTSHAMTDRVATVDRPLVERLREAVPVPLVLHGSSGLSDDELRGAVRSGLTKVNISTHLNGLFTESVRQTLTLRGDVVDPRVYVREARAAFADETARLLQLLSPTAVVAHF
ncbi:fructose-bisphosphate aldolase [Frondihabitans sp. PAMC 28766]|uniref:class II fructose-bisphosphate aldolase n=1 Tax=Frondihabitans sp. PAMC 28766 TaxID=1795630 RepID=UPI00078E5F14|nr:class II fructose-bisphosphate aldolase [Frondihabitans sp. PAMC 28766]AMM21624.1 fructose-bisphosphate aldolase [Frondihabitans sp. PAMC 28766]